jgi:hypothetical protein
MFVVSIVHSCAVPTYDLMMTHHMLTQSMQFPQFHIASAFYNVHVIMFQTYNIKAWLSYWHDFMQKITRNKREFVTVNTVSVGQPALNENWVISFFLWGENEKLQMSVKCRCATYTLHVKFPIILIYKALYLPYRWCLCQNPVKQLQYIKKYYICLCTKDSCIICETEQLYDCQRIATVTQLAADRHFKHSTTYPTSLWGAQQEAFRA